MKVLIINTKLDEGGAAKIALKIHKYINNSLNIESIYAYGRGKKLKNDLYFRFSYKLEVYLHVILSRITGISGIGTYFSTKRILKYIKENNVDLIHIHNIHGYYIDLMFLNKIQQLNIPVVWTLHDGWILTGRCAYLGECKKWEKGCKSCEYMNLYPKAYFDASKFMWYLKRKYLANKNVILVSPSKWLYKNIKKSYNRNNVMIIPNGIDINLFKPYNKNLIRKKLNLPTGKNIILFIAADLSDIRKGASYFFEAVNNIKDENLIVLTVGKTYRNNIKFNFNIIELGYIYNEKKLAMIYSASDIFCITSLEENFPTTVLESMACGTPVVGFNTGGIPEQILPDCGVVVEKCNIKDLSDNIKNLISNKDRINKMGDNARKKVVEYYSLDKMCNKYIDLYKQTRG